MFFSKGHHDIKLVLHVFLYIFWIKMSASNASRVKTNSTRLTGSNFTVLVCYTVTVVL